MSIETGLITCLLAIVELVLYFQAPPWSFLPGVIIGKVYSNSLLATLNSRSPLFKGFAVESLPGGSQVSKEQGDGIDGEADEGASRVRVDRTTSVELEGRVAV
ncbi:hypothetical protein H0H81_000613 [Sphagnurus paluster]|uniref:DUF6534 domain-containing protein n=1 Tax=Sphagnurus paluster TaxID=117069 RepID=A0A9P7FPB9_9AGAR|nr:hypothetical protein H0H81_000613 [Sphagnurus paluster]